MEPFRSGDWIRIKYGEYEGRVAKIAILKKSGEYGVILYENEFAGGKDDLPKDAIVMLEETSMQKLDPYVLDQKQLRALVRAEITYDDFAEQVFPQFNLKAERRYTMMATDIKKALVNINKQKDPLPLFKEWFWIILNVFYEDLNISIKYDENLFSDFPKDEKEIFSTVFGMTEKLYWRLEERFGRKEDVEQFLVRFDEEPLWDKPDNNRVMLEESAYFMICNDIIERIDSYLYCKGKPQGAWIYSPSQMRHVVSSYEQDEDLRKATPEERALFKDFVKKLYRLGDVTAIRILAWSYYKGNACYRQNWNKSEKLLLELFEKTGDPAAANGLGYIYFYGRTNQGVSEPERAFQYFSYAALDGIDESIYMVADMLIHGTGIRKNIDMGVEMLVTGYRETTDDICHGIFESRFAEYAFRMGEASEEGLLYGLGNRDAFRFYLETRYALQKRRPYKYFGDDVLLARVNMKIETMQAELGIDPNRTELKADYPIFINQMYESRLPVKVTIYKKRGTNDQYLKLSRLSFRELLGRLGGMQEDHFGEDGGIRKILVTYPELSYTTTSAEIEFLLEEEEILKVPENGRPFFTDEFRKNEVTGAIEFYAHGDLVAALDAKWYVIKIWKGKNI